MSVRVFEDQGGAELNKAIQVGRVESSGPAVFQVRNLDDDANVVVSFENESTGLQVYSDKDTAVSDEDTAYNGDTATLAFSGQSLNNTPIVPGSVTVKPATGGTTVNLTDTDGDGNLYTVDDDAEFAGTINYFTGALRLAFPTGKAPNTGDIDCDYYYQDAVIVPLGKRVFTISNSLPDEAIKVYAACSNSGGAAVRTESVGT